MKLIMNSNFDFLCIYLTFQVTLKKDKLFHMFMDLKKRHFDLCSSERGYEFETRQVIRINTLKANEEDVVNRLKEKDVNLVKVNGLNHAYYADSEFSLSSMPEYLFGYFYIQEIASQYVPLVLNPKP